MPAFKLSYDADIRGGSESALCRVAHEWDEGEVITAPTCTQNGSKQCTCTVCGTSGTVAVPATGHIYGEPSWTWDGYDSAKATFSCTNCTDKQELDASVERQADGKTYIAKVTFKGTEYTDTFVKQNASDTYSISVADGVAVNFYVDVPYYQAQGGQIKYTYIKDSSVESAETEIRTVNVADLPETEDGLRKLTLKVAPAQIGQELVIEVYDAEGAKKVVLSDSAADYCSAILANDSYADYHALAQALLNYAQLSKEYFGYDDGVTLAYDADHYKDDVTDNFRSRAHASRTGSIQLDSVTYMALLNPEFRFYLKDVTEEEAKALNVSVDNDLTAKVIKTEKGICVSVTGLKASDFEKVFTLNIGDTTVSYNGYAYLYTVLNNPNVTDQKLKDLAKGIYRYATAVEAVFPQGGDNG